MQSISKGPGIYIGPRRKLSGFDNSSTEHYYYCGTNLYSIHNFMGDSYYVVEGSTLWFSLELLYPGTLDELRISHPEYFI